MRDLIGDASYTFADYFKMAAEVEEILAHFRFTYKARLCELPTQQPEQAALADLRARIEESLPFLSLSNETARREFLIAPVLLETVRHTQAKLRTELAIEVNDQLNGTLDYFLRARHHVLVIEAKNADLFRGFAQLATELVALDQWLEGEEVSDRLYGAVSTGDSWRFGFLDRSARCVTQDLRLYTVPDDLETLIGILIALLTD